MKEPSQATAICVQADAPTVRTENPQPLQTGQTDGAQAAGLSISAAERETGIPKETLRIWERRYGFPTPGRDVHGDRCYSMADIERLRLVRQLTDRGHRPGRVVGQAIDVLRAMAGTPSAPPSPQAIHPADSERLQALLAVIRRHDTAMLCESMMATIAAQGLPTFISRTAAPLTVMVGEAWAAGTLAIFEEHLYTEALQTVIRAALLRYAPSPGTPRVLLTTLPDEAHGLGLLMAQAMLTAAGCHCVALGVRTPVSDIVRAACAQDIGVIALSCTAVPPTGQVLANLRRLRDSLPDDRALWIGTTAPALLRRRLRGVRLISDLGQIDEAVHDWRNRAGGGRPVAAPDRGARVARQAHWAQRL